MTTLIATATSLIAESPRGISDAQGVMQAFIGLAILVGLVVLATRVVSRAKSENTERFTELLNASDERLRERGRRALESDVVFLGSVARDERKVDAVTPALVEEVRKRVGAALTDVCREVHTRKALPVRQVKGQQAPL